MSTYSINNYLISQDLTRYAKQVGKDGNYTLGHCIVEYIEQADRIFTPELKVIDTSKAYDLIDLDQDCGFKGRVAIQETKEQTCTHCGKWTPLTKNKRSQCHITFTCTHVWNELSRLRYRQVDAANTH